SATSRSSSALPLPTKVGGSGAARRCTTRATSSAPAVSMSSDSSSRLASVSSGVSGGIVTPTRTIFSRNERSMSDMLELTSLRSRPRDLDHGDRGGVAHEQHRIAQADLDGAARHADGDGVADELPLVGGRGG